MKGHLKIFKMKFINGLQYRAAAAAGIATQFAWGFMEILAFAAFHRANPAAFPMEFSALVSYIWIQQAFLAFFAAWSNDTNAADTIVSGNISYLLARPMDIYNRWFVESLAGRVSRAVLRCFPILAVSLLLPAPFGLTLPENPAQVLFFLLSLPVGMYVVIAWTLIDSISVFYTMSRYNALFVIFADFLSGGYVPIPFFPEPFRSFAELLPFAAMANMPLRIFSGDIAGEAAVKGIALQVFWFAALTVFGKLLMKNSLKRVIAQGG